MVTCEEHKVPSGELRTCDQHADLLLTSVWVEEFLVQVGLLQLDGQCRIERSETHTIVASTDVVPQTFEFRLDLARVLDRVNDHEVQEPLVRLRTGEEFQVELAVGYLHVKCDGAVDVP